MCSPATANFSAGALHFRVGSLTLRSTRDRREFSFAAILNIHWDPCVRFRGGRLLAVRPRGLPCGVAAHGSIRRARLTSLLCRGRDDAVPGVDLT